MTETLTNIGGELIAEKGESAKLNYAFDYSTDLAAGDTITATAWEDVTGELTLSGAGFTDTQASIVVAGGVPGSWYTVKNRSTGSTGLIYEAWFRLFVTDAGALGTGLWLPFPSVPGALSSIRRDRLANLISNYLPEGTTITDSFLLEKLVAATALISRQLRTFLVPTQVLPNTATQDEIDSYAGIIPVYLEPAYDYDPSFFQGNTWGRTLTRQRPIITVQSMAFVYPTPTSTLYTIPIEWVRLDKKYGVINLLPIQNSAQLPLNAFILNALGGGRTIPNFIDIRYTAGLENVARDYPDLLDVIKKQTVLGIAEDLYVPSSRSQSVSADGLSQSESIAFQIGEYAKQIDSKIASIKSSIQGIPMWSV